MPNTTNFQIAYPSGNDYVKDGATAMGIIANGFDSLLGTIGVGGLRNAIINGDFSVNQRVFSSTTSTTVYGHDRWQLLKFGGTTTYSTQAFTVGSPAASGYEVRNYARVVTSGQSGVGDLSILKQSIEDVRTFAGAPVTVSFWARAGSGAPSIAVELSQFFGTGGTPSVDVNNLLGKVQLSTNWTRYQVSVTLPNLSGKTLGTAGDSFLGLNLWTSAGSTWNTRTGTLGIQNATIDIWGVQVERGTRATPFERRPPGVELMLCQRYYEKSYRLGTAPGAVDTNGMYVFQGVSDSTGLAQAMMTFRVPKRNNTYTATGYTDLGTVANWLYVRSGVATTNTVVTLDLKSEFTMRVYGQIGANYAACQFFGHWVVDAEFS